MAPRHGHCRVHTTTIEEHTALSPWVGRPVAFNRRTAPGLRLVEFSDGPDLALAGGGGNELPVNVTILQSLPKGNKLEFIIQKGTELGASRFFLFASERSIVKWDEKKVKNRLERYEKIAKEASEQAKRNVIPEILYVENLHDLLDNLNDVKGSKLIAYEDEAKREPATSLATQLKNVETNGEILVAIGPEGGFSEEEVKLFQNNGFVPVRLGKRILRTETAPLYVLSAISYHFEELE